MRKTYIIALLLFLLLIVLVLVSSCELYNTTNKKNILPEEDENTCADAPGDVICGDDGLTYQNSCYSSLRNVGVDHVGACMYEVCSFNNVDHYIMDNMIYYEDDKGRPYIAVLYGEFYQNINNGWTYVSAVNKESSYYTNRMLEYESRMTESDNPVVCVETTDIREHLQSFLITHGKILDLKIESYNETDNNATDNAS